jgi:cell division protein FtsB
MPPPTAKPAIDLPSAGLASLAFWVCLFTAAAAYAAVSLAAKIVTHDALYRRQEMNQWRLVALEKQVTRLRKVVAAHGNDPAFVRERVRADFEFSEEGEQRIPVDSHLTLNIGSPPVARNPVASTPGPYVPWLRRLAHSRKAGDLLLVGAAALVIGAFVFLPATRRQ